MPSRHATLLVLAVVTLAATLAAAAPYTSHFADVESALAEVAAASRGSGVRAAERRAARAALRRLRRADGASLADDLRLAKRLAKDAETRLRRRTEIMAAVVAALDDLAGDLEDRRDALDDVLTYDVTDDDLYFDGLAGLADAARLLLAAESPATPRQRARALLDADAALDGVAALVGGETRSLSGTYVGDWELAQSTGTCELSHYGEITLALKHRTSDGGVTGSAVLEGFEVLDGECGFVETRTRSGSVTATWDGTSLEGTLTVNGLRLELHAELDGGMLVGTFDDTAADATGSFSAGR